MNGIKNKTHLMREISAMLFCWYLLHFIQVWYQKFLFDCARIPLNLVFFVCLLYSTENHMRTEIYVVQAIANIKMRYQVLTCWLVVLLIYPWCKGIVLSSANPIKQQSHEHGGKLHRQFSCCERERKVNVYTMYVSCIGYR